MVLFLRQNGVVLGIIWLLFWVHLVGIKGTTWWLFLEVNGGCWWRGKNGGVRRSRFGTVFEWFWEHKIQRIMYGRWNMMNFIII